MRREDQDVATGAHIEFDAVGRHAAPVGVEAAGQRRMRRIHRRAHRLGDAGVHAIGADDDRCSFLDSIAAHADDAVAVADDVAHQHAFPHLGAGFARGIDQQLVEHGAARAIHRRRAVDRLGPPAKSDRARMHVHRLDQRAAGRRQRVEQAPARQRRRGARPQEMGRHGVARKMRAIERQHVPATPCQQHRQRSAGAAYADDDRVVGRQGGCHAQLSSGLRSGSPLCIARW